VDKAFLYSVKRPPHKASFISIPIRLFFASLLLGLPACRQAVIPENMSAPSVPAVTLALLGDVMLGRGVQPSEHSFSFIWPLIAASDLALANLESPLTDQPPEVGLPYILCAPPKNVKYLAEAGFDIFSLANNHAGDCGMTGELETRSALSEAGLKYLVSEAEPLFLEVNDVLLAFLALDDVSGLDLHQAVMRVNSARDQGALVIVSMHWGMEYQSAPSPRQVLITEHLSEAGASLIWGHHPHVLQPAEWINDGKTLVLYSLGNALFDQHGLAGTRQSALVLVRLDSTGIVDFRAEPFIIDVPDSRIVEPSKEEKEIIGRYFNIQSGSSEAILPP
jgi:poly-gamma-glutamate synthesis protein (capsule biosynthesis protein)